MKPKPVVGEVLHTSLDELLLDAPVCTHTHEAV